ncbi:hypothetical protein PLICRDRAFT_571288 [Plicaturopsis crispa FD-325 SS-3]|nr:hypothetical protein PLICRDRAFT_571288 [Plicaturopsis crispa FD-325 SS-3]
MDILWIVYYWVLAVVSLSVRFCRRRSPSRHRKSESKGCYAYSEMSFAIMLPTISTSRSTILHKPQALCRRLRPRLSNVCDRKNRYRILSNRPRPVLSCPDHVQSAQSPPAAAEIQRL